MGNAYQKQGQLNQAIICYYKAVALKPDYFEAFNSLANALVEFGKMPEAIEYYGKALEINPAYTVGHSNLLLRSSIKASKALSILSAEAEKWWQQHAGSSVKPGSCKHPIVSREAVENWVCFTGLLSAFSQFFFHAADSTSRF